jgi:glycine/D-amino acid oxidase-like deaminating enzyme
MNMAEAVNQADVAIIGGGAIGLAIGYGLKRRSLDVAILDAGEPRPRASRGNFGLVWVQGKGAKNPAYARWSRTAALAWPALADELRDETGIEVDLRQGGGFYLCLSEADFAARIATFTRMREDLDGEYPFETLDRVALAERMPAVGPDVVGGTFHPDDGDINPLKMCRALQSAFLRRGGRLYPGRAVDSIVPLSGGGFRLSGGGRTMEAGKIVIAAGLGCRDLAPMVGLAAPVTPQRGQLLISSRVRPFLDFPTAHIRQTAEGTVQIGDTKEDVGFDTGTTLTAITAMAQRAIRTFPVLAGVSVVRAWSCLRILTPDIAPIYSQSDSCPGAYVAACHSGITLGSLHAGVLARWIADGTEPFANFEVFHGKRFPVPPPAAGA